MYQNYRPGHNEDSLIATLGGIDDFAAKSGVVLNDNEVMSLFLGYPVSTVMPDPEIWFKLNESGIETTAVNSGTGSNMELTSFNFTPSPWILRT